MDIITERDPSVPIWKVRRIRYNQPEKVSYVVRFPDGELGRFTTYQQALKAYQRAVAEYAKKALDR